MTATLRAVSSNERARTPQRLTHRGARRACARRTSLPTLLLACAACGESRADDAARAITRRDSAGIAIVEIPASVLASLPVERVAAEPAFKVGVVEGRDEEMFGMVTDALLMPDGAVAIADAQQLRVLIFEPDGTFRQAVGGEGSGPGEFRQIYGISLIGDTLFVPDLGNDRIQAFAADGTLLDSRTIAGGIGLQMGLWHHRPGRWTWPYAFQITANDYPRDVPEGDGPHGILQVTGRYDTLSGMRFDTVASAPGYWVRLGAEERAAATEEGLTHYAISNVVPHPLAPTVHAAFLVDRPVTGWSGSDELRIHDDEGVTQRIIRFEPTELAAAAEDARYRAWVVSFHDRGHRPLMRRAWNAPEPPAEPPRFHDLRTHVADDIWVAIAPEEVESDARLWTRWLRFGADGTPRGWLIAPPVEILDLTPEALIALERDELDVPRVAVYRFRNAF
jgi:6-bladed beta-propeller